MATKAKKLNVFREDLSEALHTALRQSCGSRPTTYLWNFLYVVDGGVWDRYLDYVWAHLSVLVPKGEQPHSIVKTASKEFRLSLSKNDDKLEWHSVVLLDLMFEDFSDEDWEGYASFLSEG